MVHKVVGHSGLQPEVMICSGEDTYLSDRIDVLKGISKISKVK